MPMHKRLKRTYRAQISSSQLLIGNFQFREQNIRLVRTTCVVTFSPGSRSVHEFSGGARCVHFLRSNVKMTGPPTWVARPHPPVVSSCRLKCLSSKHGPELAENNVCVVFIFERELANPLHWVQIQVDLTSASREKDFHCDPVSLRSARKPAPFA